MKCKHVTLGSRRLLEEWVCVTEGVNLYLPSRPGSVDPVSGSAAITHTSQNILHPWTVCSRTQVHDSNTGM